MASGGPWGGGGSGGDDRGNGRDDERKPGGQRPANGGPQIPEIDEIVKKGQEQLRVLMGGRGKGGGTGGGGGGRGPSGPRITKQGIALGALAAVALWGFMSFYTVRPEERSVELFLGEFSTIGNPGLNFAPWPLVTAEIVQVTNERTTDIGVGRTGEDGGLMLTRDQNIVDIGFQVVWNIEDPSKFLFNLADPSGTMLAVSESAMRDIIARSELAPILNRDRGAIATDLRAAVQNTLDSYDAGLNVIRVNFEKADPPREVIDAFRAVQAAQQERDRLEKEADGYANRVTAGARGEAARIVEEAEAYRARVVNDASGEASRFLSVYAEYVKAPEVTRKRMYLETMEQVLGSMNKVILDGVQGGEGGGQGVVPFLPLNELGRQTPASAPAAAATTGGNN
ncbi:FtsH protease activity modulator HflK [Pseudotabrizicola alkalilacus]|uniref:Protein HflK n=1 Tax=Pseudotabrizicola alkalilacus TaxID=2305252 RepID=A0A411Z2A8_9RHOB|nr:FtsH protease activity modulator HflK [Pseudotabrizicola alkalilacus]RGP37170.1 FtsH protease activity modulator HflK [Pseudotabrizicola alkalilacus]